jgi:flagellar basal body-associated protein FliL
MSRAFSKIFLIIMAVVIMLTFLVGSFFQPRLQQATAAQQQQIQVPASQVTTQQQTQPTNTSQPITDPSSLTSSPQ